MCPAGTAHLLRLLLAGQKTLAGHKLLWAKYQDIQDQWKEDRKKQEEGKRLLTAKQKELNAAQAPRRCTLLLGQQ